MKICEILPRYNEIINDLSHTLEIPQVDVKDAILRSYVIDYDETDNRLRQVLCKAYRGEKITVAAIGGSITEDSGEKCWFERVSDWFKSNFPNTTVDSVNAGIGSTSSFLGVFRLEPMVLKFEPDLVFIDFSLNDMSAAPDLLRDEIFESYEAIVRRLLELGIAVIPIFFVNKNGDSFQKIHTEIADHYNMPAISYQNAICPSGEFICEWSKLFLDNTHPNNVGHTFIAACITNYLDNVLYDTELSANYTTDELHTSWIYFDTFKNTYAQYAYEFQNRARLFEFIENMPNISCKWRGVLISENCEASVKLIVPKGAKRVYIQYFSNNGSFETKFLNQKTSCNTANMSCPRAMWHRVYTGDAIAEDSEIIIKSHQNGKVILQGLLVAF